MTHKLFLAAFVGAACVGAACTSSLTEACEEFRTVRDACEAQNLDPPPMYGFDLCENIDPDCEFFYRCVALAPCLLNKQQDKYRLTYTADECPLPENKECTDADLRP